MKVCIDAGHGGKDPGAINGTYHEADAALVIAMKLGQYLAKCSVENIYTRTSDVYVPLYDRTWVANSNEVDCFISIHLNSAENKDANGIEVLRYPTKNIKTIRLSELVQDSLIKYTSMRDRGVKERDDLYVLKKTKMPAILCEVGFISNNEECEKLFSEDMQNKTVKAIGNAIVKWLEEVKE